MKKFLYSSVKMKNSQLAHTEAILMLLSKMPLKLTVHTQQNLCRDVNIFMCIFTVILQLCSNWKHVFLGPSLDKRNHKTQHEGWRRLCL